MQPRLFLREKGEYHAVLKCSSFGRTFFVTRTSGREHPCECFFLPSFEYLDRLRGKVRLSSQWFEILRRKAEREVIAAIGVDVKDLTDMDTELHMLEGYPVVRVGFTSRFRLPGLDSLEPRMNLLDVHELAAELLFKKDPRLLEAMGGYDKFSRFVRKRLQGEPDASRLRIHLTEIGGRVKTLLERLKKKKAGGVSSLPQARF